MMEIDVTPAMIDAAQSIIREACDHEMKRDPWFNPWALGLFADGSLIERIYRAMVDQSAVEVVE